MPDNSTASAYDIVIVGGGPVGTTTALKLGRAGFRVALLEKRSAVALDHRASTFHPPTLEMLDELGLVDDLLSQGIVARSYQFRDAKLGMIVDLDYSVLDGDTRFPYRLQVEQSRLTDRAIQALETEPTIDAFFGREVISISDTEGGYSVSWSDDDGSGVIHGRRLIGADGMHSVVRSTLGLDFTGHTYPERYLVVTTKLPLEELLDDLAVVNYVADPVDWHVLLRNPSGWRILFPTHGESDAELLDPANIEAQMRRVVPHADHYPVEHVTLYQVHRKVASSFRVGSAFLVGDAAHVNNPLGGMGMNSGIHDGQFLADAIIAFENGQAGEADLDGWADARRKVALEYVGAETDSNWKSLRDDDEQRRELQREKWRALGSDSAARRDFLLTSSMLASVRA
ncbi:FAD-dependent oxidoreductase [Microbacter sp. GSS18]|nr:FAD-dependent oxidoreductase [Microbacter sp. GSS18]